MPVNKLKPPKLRPSSASRWQCCPPSAFLEAQYEDKPNDFTQEGNEAHRLAEKALRGECQLDSEIPMHRYVRAYVDYCQRLANYNPYEVEQRVPLEPYLPEQSGIIDFVCRDADVLHIADFKYGRGVKVSAKDNSQMRMYALAYIESRGLRLDGINCVSMSIYQPRIPHSDVETVSIEELYDWAENELQPAIEKALRCGKHCGFCKARTNCPGWYGIFTGVMHARDSLTKLSEYDRAYILRNGDELIKFIKAVQSEALNDILSGQKITGFKVIEGRGRRAIKFPDALLSHVESWDRKNGTHFANEITELKLAGLTDMKSLLPKMLFSELEQYIVKSAGSPKLVTTDTEGESFSYVSDFD